MSISLYNHSTKQEGSFLSKTLANLTHRFRRPSTPPILLHDPASRTVTFTVHTAHVPAPHNHSQHNQCITPYAAVHTLVLLMRGIMMPETCWDRSLIINMRLVASCWFLFLHPTSQHVIAVIITLSNKLKDISRACPKHVGTSGKLTIWPPREANNLVPLKTSNIFDWRQSWWTFLRVHAQIVDNFEKNYFAYENWRLLPSYLWLLQWHHLLLPYFLLLKWCLSTPGSCLAHPPLSTALDISTAHWSLSVLLEL